MQMIETTPEAIFHLKTQDEQMKAAVDRIGPISREMNEDIFVALMESILSQQISGKAARTVWARLLSITGIVTPDRILECEDALLQSAGLSFRKVSYMKRTAQAIKDEIIDINRFPMMSDADIISELVKLPGIGVWTAEMLLIFSLGRQDVVSFNDFGIRKGMMKLYELSDLSKEQFMVYRKRYAPFGTAASLFLWEIAGGR
ncbi:MAG: DNA-3-methyladenine glycosylase 2 family protein [Sphaerochaetaceae bacterium]